MNEEQKDKGLRKALQQPAPYRLPSNFTFRTMLKVEEAVRLKEKKQERRMLWATIAASFLLIAGGVGALFYCFGEELGSMFAGSLSLGKELDLWSSPCCSMSVIFLILLGLDYWMRRVYFKRHPKGE